MQLSMKFFMSLMLIVGLVLTLYAFRINSHVNDCSKAVQNAARGLIVMGVILVSVSSTYMVCGCSKSLSTTALGMGFVLLMLVIGVTVISLTSIIHSGCKNARKSTPLLISLAVLTVVLSGSYLTFNIFGNKDGYKPLEKTDMTASF